MNSRKIPSSLWMIIVLILAIGGILLLTVSANQQTTQNLKLPLQITEYFDYNCSHCIEFHDEFKTVIAKYGDKVQITYSLFPFLGDESYTLAYAAEAAKQQGKFLEFHDAIFAANKNRTTATLDIDAMAKTVKGLDIQKFDFDRQSSIIKDLVTAEKNDAVKLGISSTPTVFIQGKSIESYVFSDGSHGGVGTVDSTGKTNYTLFEQTLQRMIDIATNNN